MSLAQVTNHWIGEDPQLGNASPFKASRILSSFSSLSITGKVYF
jgi:hypothetical protein